MTQIHRTAKPTRVFRILWGSFCQHSSKGHCWPLEVRGQEHVTSPVRQDTSQCWLLYITKSALRMCKKQTLKTQPWKQWPIGYLQTKNVGASVLLSGTGEVSLQISGKGSCNNTAIIYWRCYNDQISLPQMQKLLEVKGEPYCKLQNKQNIHFPSPVATWQRQSQQNISSFRTKTRMRCYPMPWKRRWEEQLKQQFTRMGQSKGLKFSS